MTEEWIVLIPLKRFAVAKSRLTCPTPRHRRSVARAMAETVVSTASCVRTVREVVLVTAERWNQEAAPAVVITEPVHGGLNLALAHAARAIAASWPDCGVAALLGDTAAGTPEEIGACLAAAAPHRRSFLADEAGTGTVLLTAAPGVGLEPHFGADSRSAHARSGAVDLTTGLDVPFLRRDLDTTADLAAVAGRLRCLPRLDGALRGAGWTGQGFREPAAATPRSTGTSRARTRRSTGAAGPVLP